MPKIVQQWKRFGCAAAAALGAVALSGCHQDMWNQPRLTALQPSPFFENGMGNRDVITGTVPYEGARRSWTHPVYEAQTGERQVPSLVDTVFYTGKTEEGLLEDNYFEVTRGLLERGRERFEINCMPCHGLVGDGRGVVALRGFPFPASYHTDRLREVEDGHIFDVITNGFGRMYSYAARVEPEDRWAIAAYIRALQTSQNLDITDQNTPIAQMVKSGLAEQQQHTTAQAAGDAAQPQGEEAPEHGDTSEVDHGEAADGEPAPAHGAVEEAAAPEAAHEELAN